MLLADIAMAILPPLATVPQLMILREKKSIGSFSIFVPAILLIANIMRIFFWISVGFAFNLLIQSILMIIMQVLIISILVGTAKIVCGGIRPFDQVIIVLEAILEMGDVLTIP